MLAAVLACGNGTVVSHGTAAELLGLWDWRPVVIDVIARGQSGRKIEGVCWHRAFPPGPEEVTVRDGVPCTNASRTLVDLAGSLGEKSLRGLVEQAAVLRLLDIRAVDRVLAGGRRRGAPQLRSILAAWRSEDEGLPRLRSIMEARLLAAVVALTGRLSLGGGFGESANGKPLAFGASYPGSSPGSPVRPFLRP